MMSPSNCPRCALMLRGNRRRDPGSGVGHGDDQPWLVREPAEPLNGWYFTMRSAQLSMNTVIELGLKLPDVKESPYYGARALMLNGQMVACTPVNKSAEVNSAAVAMNFEQRATLLRKHPSLYYVTDHYVPHRTMLIRLSKISRVELARTLRVAWKFAASESSAPRSSDKAKRGSARAASVRSKSRVG